MSHSYIVEAKSPWQPLPRLALPVLAEETLTLMVTWTDWWLCGHFLGHHGDSAKAAMGLMGYTMWLIPSLFAAVAIGATALVARYMGGQDIERAQRTANQSVLIGIAFAVVLTLTFALLGNQFVAAMQLKGEAGKLAVDYLWIIVPIIPLIMFEQVGAACLRGAGDTVTGMIAKSIVVIVNIAISATLVTGWGPFPDLGWIGLAIGTATGHAIGGLILFTALLRGRARMKLQWRWLKPDFSLIGKLLRIGVPGGTDLAALLGAQLVFVAIVNSLGESAAAAHGLAVQIEACAYLPGHAFQVAAATLAGQYLGAGKPVMASRSSLYCFAVACFIMVTAGTIMYFWGDHVAYFFTGNWEDPTTHNSARLLKIVAFAMPSLAFVMVITGALRGAGDTVWPLVFTLFGFLVIRIPLAAYLACSTFTVPVLNIQMEGLGWGVQGAWYAMATDLTIRALFALVRFSHGGWKNVKI